MGYAARASSGERPRDVTVRRFQQEAAVAIVQQADVINNQRDVLMQVQRDLVALAADHAILKQGMLHFESLTFLGRLLWLFAGK
jgi:hypothetical protein